MDSKGLRELTDIYLKEISADTALAASKKADVERGKAAAGGDREKAKAKQHRHLVCIKHLQKRERRNL